MYRFRFAIVIAGVTAAALTGVPAAAQVAAGSAVPANVDVSQRHLNESEEAVAVNPTNPDNIVMVTNVGHAEAGLTARRIIITHMSADMLTRQHDACFEPARDGLVVSL